ncbi:MAG TPA: hypothetical protein VEI25_20660, partial [Paraburkholderia sp.]|nr:hypothetical protein [Paraburkholderia sp.]
MRHTVIGLFETYTQAEAARDKLVEIGFGWSEIELQANPEPPTAADIDRQTARDIGRTSFMANIEHFFSSLFASG